MAGSSILECGRANAQHIAERCAEFVRDNELYRGCPPTAKAVSHAVPARPPTSLARSFSRLLTRFLLALAFFQPQRFLTGQ